ncbi:GNAT family acetyltransferase [Herbiconiux sp. P18]|uniref:GNAT family acetyltransferase n=1 Tax=Herbiconiux liangxiaofengii TaxID=3342795 RepID=UPI0035BA9BA5
MARPRNLADQQQRLSEATWSVLTERGLAGLTIRAVAEVAGCTTGLVMHAFPTKQALLLHARDLLHERTRIRADAVEADARSRALPGAAESGAREAVEAVLMNAMSLDAQSADEARVWVSFLAAALTDPVLADRHRAGNRAFVARVTRLLAECRPEWPTDRLGLEARSLVALAEGMNTLGAADPDTYPPALQRSTMSDALARTLPTPSPAPSSAELRRLTPSDPEGGHFGATRRGGDQEGGMRIRSFERDDTETVVALWAACGLTRPWNDPRRDIERKLTVQPELFLVGVDTENHVVATAMAGYDGHRGWVNYLAVEPSRQGRGDGRALMAEVERLLTERGCPKLNLQIRHGNEPVMDFYRALGYTEDAAASFGKRLISDA